MSSLRLALRVLRLDRRSRMSAVLLAGGVAVATALILLLVAVPYATQARADRAAWQEPGSDDAAHPSMSIADSTDVISGREITRIDVAALADVGTLPAGVPEVPAPGEVVVSPALAELMGGMPSARLADRFPGDVVATLGPDALAFPEQLVALVGHAPGDMPSDADPVAGFPAGPGRADGALQLLAGVGIVVLLVPSLVLAASASRLTAARRERRLAALRLAGASPGQVGSLVAAETGLAAGAGAALGLAVSPLAHRLGALVSWDGGTWWPADFALPWWLRAVIVVAMPLLVLLAATLGMRRVLRSPLAAAAAHAPKPLRWWRLLAVPAAGLLFFLAIQSGGKGGGLAVFATLAALIGAAALVGPWITAAIGGLFRRAWRKPATMLAGGRLTDDPRGAYRASAGVVIAVFTGSMALTLLPSFDAMAGGGNRMFQDSVLYVSTDAAHADEIVRETNERLAGYRTPGRAVGVPEVWLSAPDGGSQRALVLDCALAGELTPIDPGGVCAGARGVYAGYLVELAGVRVSAEPGGPGTPLAAGTPMRPVPTGAGETPGVVVIDPAAVPGGVVQDTVLVAVPTTPRTSEVVRTALAAASDGEQIRSRDTYLADQQTQLADLRRVTVIGLIAAAVLAGCSAAIATAGSIMDRRRTFGALIAAGTPVGLLARALRIEAALPALAATIGAGAVGTVAGIGLFGLASADGVVLSPLIATPVVLGIGVALLAGSVCKPALRRIQSEPLTSD